MTLSPPLPETADLAARLQAAVAQTPGRIQQVWIDGTPYWVKQREELGLRLRLQKGNPARAFDAERAGLHDLAARALPVAPIVAEGPGFFATADHGPTLAHLIRHNSLPEAERIAAFTAAGRGLAAFHAQGVSHGRPSVRDICWDGDKVTFIDLERYHTRRDHLSGHAQDLIMFVLSAYTVTGQERAEIDAACDAYRGAAPDAVWQMARRWCRWLRWIDPLTRPLQRGPRRRAEFAAIPLTLRRFGVLPPAQA